MKQTRLKIIFVSLASAGLICASLYLLNSKQHTGKILMSASTEVIDCKPSLTENTFQSDQNACLFAGCSVIF